MGGPPNKTRPDWYKNLSHRMKVWDKKNCPVRNWVVCDEVRDCTPDFLELLKRWQEAFKKHFN